MTTKTQPGTVRALTILRAWDPCSTVTATRFAERMWPDSPCWTKHHKCGAYGASAGMGMPLAGGSFLAKLRKRGLITATNRVTDGGMAILESAEEEAKP